MYSGQCHRLHADVRSRTAHLTISLSSGLYRRYRNSTGSVPVSRESRTVTAGREFHPALRISVQRYGKVLSMQEISVKFSPHIKTEKMVLRNIFRKTIFSEKSARFFYSASAGYIMISMKLPAETMSLMAFFTFSALMSAMAASYSLSKSTPYSSK